jgi:hypothetical protein
MEKKLNEIVKSVLGKNIYIPSSEKIFDMFLEPN